MHLEIGEIYEGRVKSITQYGAFVEVAGGEGERPVTGMVHISEVANTFVRDIHDFLQEDDVVRVKVIAVNPQGKISMSVKQADAAEGEPQKQELPPRKRRESQKPRIYEPKRSVPQSEMSFEDKLLHFKQASEEKICDLKRGSERRGGSRSRRS
ncbi:MAG: S1 RNA-binding domain-containing protein [Oscillospiraceae bacterium]|nr:S1 RNA-binding domain-containing protein [Oscillospiraceae bacterium]